MISDRDRQDILILINEELDRLETKQWNVKDYSLEMRKEFKSQYEALDRLRLKVEQLNNGGQYV